MSNRRFISDYEIGFGKMGARVFLEALILVILLSVTTWSQSPYIGGLTGSASSPVSQTQQSLFRSPGQYDTGGNNLIVGTVRGGSYFRGSVPYQSTTSFRGSVPSADTTYSFMRYSAGSESFAREPGKYSRVMPYYNPSQTVTFTRPGQSAVFTPTSASAIKSVGSGAGDEFARMGYPSRQVLGGTTSASDIGLRPMSMSLQETERLISAEVGGIIEPESQLVRGGVSTTEAAKQRAGQVDQRATDLRIRPVDKEGIQQRFEPVGRPYTEEPAEVEGMAIKRIERERALEQMREQMLAERRVESEDSGRATAGYDPTSEISARTSTGLSQMAGVGGEQQDLFDTYMQVKKQIDNLQAALEQLRADKGAGGVPSSLRSVSDYGRLRPDGLERKETVEAEKVPEQLDVRYSGVDTELQAFRKNVERLAAESTQMDKSTAAGISAEAKRILGGKSIAAFSEDKYNEYMKAAEMYQKQGKYYRAASAYTLASIYKPDEALAHAGRSLALFAAGEYMSSALYLSRAIELSPEYAKTKVDLLAILGTDDKEQLTSRIDEIEQWYKRSDESDLQFLLGYVYYQAGELDKAKEAIDAVHTRMPNLPAVNTLKKVIDNK